MEDESVQFLPFHAINQFMRPDYRLAVLRATFTALPDLPDDFRSPVERLSRQLVQVPGFRNSAKAPVGKKVRPAAEAFEKSPALVATVLSAWAQAHADLRQQVFEMLQQRGWELLPPDADRTQLPGFFPTWPHGEDFATLNKAFQDAFPETKESEDDISLMVVWLSARLPYQMDEEEAEEQEIEGDEETAS
jgi:hypothetical protein